MTSLNVIAWGAALGFLYFSLLCIAAWRRLWHIPGPFWARFTHLWIIRRILTGDYIQGLLDLHIKYGPVVVVAPNFVSLSDPEEIRQIGKVRSKWGRAEGYHAFRLAPGTSGDSILSVRDDKAHARMRAKLMPGYAGRTVEGVEQMVNKHVSQLGEVILSRHITTPGKSYHPVDFSRLAEHLTIDIITSFAFQESFDCLERDDDFHGYLEAVRKAVAPLVAFAFIPMYARMMDISALGALFPEGGFLPRIFEVAKRQVHKRYGEEAHVLKGRNDVLSTWIAGGLSEDELVNETVAQLGAGGETTSTGIRATMLYLLTSPHAYRALQREIDDALRLRLVTSCPLSEKEVNHLPYLQAVVKESIRLIAPAGFFPKSSPSDEMLCGYRIPAGVSVELAFKPALRDEDIFGEDAAFFRPERWIEADSGRLKLMDETHRFVFGGPSRWECLGKGLAYMQMHKVVFELFRQFDFALVDPVTPWKAYGTRVWVIKDFFVQITSRNQRDIDIATAHAA